MSDARAERPESRARASRRRDALARHRLVAGVLTTVVVLAAAGLVVLVLYARGGGPLPDALGFLRPAGSDPLAPSSPEETVLRTLRLAGYEHASVGEKDGTVVVRVAVPRLGLEADVGLGWQTAMSAAAEAFPDSSRIVAQLFDERGSQGLVQVIAPRAAVERATRAGDPKLLRADAKFSYITESER